MTLRDLAFDYFAHLEHHVRQIFGRELIGHSGLPWPLAGRWRQLPILLLIAAEAQCAELLYIDSNEPRIPRSRKEHSLGGWHLFQTVNPIGNTAIFLSLTRGYPRRRSSPVG